jgi:hypothetical protein
MESNGATTLIVLAIWIGLGFVCSSIWQKKGGSAGAGFALGVLLGLIGLLIVALATPSGASRSAVGTSAAVQTAKPGVTWTHTGFRYLLGYLVDPPMYGIWDRQAPGSPVTRFPYSEHGKSEAFDRFQEFEPRGAPVAANPSLPPPPPASGASGAWASGPAS